MTKRELTDEDINRIFEISREKSEYALYATSNETVREAIEAYRKFEDERRPPVYQIVKVTTTPAKMTPEEQIKEVVVCEGDNPLEMHAIWGELQKGLSNMTRHYTLRVTHG